MVGEICEARTGPCGFSCGAQGTGTARTAWTRTHTLAPVGAPAPVTSFLVFPSPAEALPLLWKAELLSVSRIRFPLCLSFPSRACPSPSPPLFSCVCLHPPPPAPPSHHTAMLCPCPSSNKSQTPSASPSSYSHPIVFTPSSGPNFLREDATDPTLSPQSIAI